jgi:hypothetical protein
MKVHILFPSLPLDGGLFGGGISVRGASPEKRAALRFAGTLAVGIILAVTLWSWHLRLRNWNDSLANEILQMEKRRDVLATSAEDARAIEPRVRASLTKATDVENELNADKWTAALRGIAVSSGPGIELRAIYPIRKVEDPRPCGLRIDGVAFGRAPRAVADLFRVALERELRTSFHGDPTCRFDRLEDMPETANPDDRGATFTISAPVGATIPSTRANGRKN